MASPRPTDVLHDVRRALSARLAPDRAGRVPAAAPYPALAGLSPERTVQLAYELLLGREPDPTGGATYLPPLADGSMSPQLLAQALTCSAEWWTCVPFTQLGPSLHASRSMFVRSLPPARRILDLGGTALGNDSGAMVLLGYPYEFDEIIVVDLPSEDRNQLYQDAEHALVETDRGPVRYRYHSMVDLSDYADGSVDLVYCGQSIEHVSLEDADTVLAEIGASCGPAASWASTPPTPGSPACTRRRSSIPTTSTSTPTPRWWPSSRRPGSRWWRPRGSTGPVPDWSGVSSRRPRWRPPGGCSPTWRTATCWPTSVAAPTEQPGRRIGLGARAGERRP